MPARFGGGSTISLGLWRAHLPRSGPYTRGILAVLPCIVEFVSWRIYPVVITVGTGQDLQQPSYCHASSKRAPDTSTVSEPS